MQWDVTSGNTDPALLFRDSALEIYMDLICAWRDGNQEYFQQLLWPFFSLLSLSPRHPPLQQRYHREVCLKFSVNTVWVKVRQTSFVSCQGRCAALSSLTRSQPEKCRLWRDSCFPRLHISASPSRPPLCCSLPLPFSAASCCRIVKESHWPS